MTAGKPGKASLKLFRSIAFGAALLLPMNAGAPALAEDSGVEQAFTSFALPRAQSHVSAGAVDIAAIAVPIEIEPETTSLGSGVASYYGRRFHGRPTASGARFDMHALTAAHRTLPFGSKVRITNRSSGKSVTVTINDRGPFVRGRTIDVSRAAAQALGLIRRGHAEVELELLQG